MKNIKVTIIVDYKKAHPFVLDIRKLKDDVVRILDLTKNSCSLEVKLTDDKEIEKLNMDFLGLYGPTNVLSFPSEEKDLLGSICISLDTISREAFLYKQGTEKYFYNMLIHGILHLLGYEHGEIMELDTENILKRLFGDLVVN